VLDEHRPAVVAIDCSLSWARRGPSRACEQVMRALGINIFNTPTEGVGAPHPFYGWIVEGLKAFQCALDAGYRVATSAPVSPGSVIEVFPHATTVALLGYVPPATKTIAAKKALRAGVLHDAGVDIEANTRLDLLDASLAALTGLYALRGDAVAVGDADEGAIFLPTEKLPDRYLRR
jgi:predicted nuclease with RNAse H fold